MTLHTLEMVLKMQSGDVMSGLDSIQDKIVNLVDQVSNFKPTTIFSDAQVEAVAAISEAMRTTDRLTGLVSNRNLENYLVNLEDLKVAVDKAEILAEQGVNIEESVQAQRRMLRLTQRIEGYYDKIDGLVTSNSRLLEGIVSNKVSIVSLTKRELKDIEAIADAYESMKKAGVDIESKLGVSSEHLEKISEFSDRAKEDFKTWDDVLKSTGGAMGKLIPGAEKFSALLHPIDTLGDELSRVNSIFEENHTVNNVFVSDMQRGATVTEAFATVQQNATKQGILLAESQRSLNAVLQSGAVYFEQNGDLLEEYVTRVAKASRATGIHEQVLADLSLRSDALGNAIGKTTKITDTFVNVMAENRLTTAQMSKIAGVLQKDLSRIDTQFKIVSKDGKLVASGSEVIASMMGEIAASAREAGSSAEAAMDLMARAIEDPLSVAPLLQSALNADTIGEQFLEMGINAANFVDQMEGMAPAMQKVFAQRLGTTPEQLRSLADGTKEYRTELNQIQDATKRQARMEEIAAEITAKRTNETEAAKNMQESQENATRELAAAVDQLRIVFGKIAVVMQPILSFIAEMVTLATQYDLAKWAIVFGSALLVLAGPLKIIKSLGSGVSSVFGSMGESLGGLSKKAGGGGFLKSLGDSIAGFITTLSKIPAKGALQAALVISAVGVSLAIGVGAIGLAANLLPPDKVAMLAVTVGGLLGVMITLAIMGPIGAPALMGAVLLLAVGAALAGGVALIGLAANLLPPDKVQELALIVGGLLATMVVVALMAPVAVPALVGALALLAVGAALAGGITLMGLSTSMLPSDKAKDLAVTIGLLLATMVTVALISPVAVPALVGALALLAVGAALAGGIALLGLSIRLMPPNKMKSLIMTVGTLVAAMGAMALMAVFAAPALIGATALLAVSAMIAGSIAILGSVAGGLDNFAGGIERLANGLDKLNPEMGRNLLSIGAGLAAFAAALVGGEIASFLGADIVDQAASMAQAMSIMQGPIVNIASMGGDAAGAFKMIGEGLMMMSGALASGGIMSFLTGNTVENAMDLAKAMVLVANPVSRIGNIGSETAKVFIMMADGLKKFIDVLKEDAGWFDSFEDNAKDIAIALSKISAPMKDIANIQSPNIESSIENAAKIQAEEIKSALAVTIERGSEKDDMIIEKLEEIRVAIEESGIGGGAADDQLVEEVRKSTSVLQDILTEMSMGNSFGSSVADSRYNV